MSTMTRGRPALTAEVQTRIARKVRRGSSIKLAAPACGIPWDTAKVWLRRGRNPELTEDGEIADVDAIYVEFYDAMQQAKAAWATGSIASVNRAGKADWKAHAYLLERRVAGFRNPGQQQRKQPERDPTLLPPGAVPALPPPPSHGAANAGEQTRTILVYPVALPPGADQRSYQLPQGHAFETVDTEGEETE